MELIIGNKNYSSWSLRAWFMLKAFDLPFTERRLALFEDEFYNEIARYAPSGKVPALIDNGIKVWDSLAICEYVNDNYIEGKGWPAEVADKAMARSVVSEMHSGFFALRNELPMNCRAVRRVELSDDARKDIGRIDAMWQQLRAQNAGKGPWLFGELSIVDVFYAPVAIRFKGYGISVSKESEQYILHILNHPAIQLWVSDAENEQEIIEIAEAGEPA
ncbi:glutathione S-transferase family protein [Oceanospirillum sediminis]|uniref:Glutathione S-transferase family protein n=1 Tax=Oceanospirillum sediminis TaxID=2760088 RepID=A0A839IUS4_9GAMM|nr:glutathione S-transferase family protein [Oceanospirillum sediminis]MBB1489203.1 glutathione S-transferase family protein [Oceanospirillum sediminis]